MAKQRMVGANARSWRAVRPRASAERQLRDCPTKAQRRSPEASMSTRRQSTPTGASAPPNHDERGAVRNPLTVRPRTRLRDRTGRLESSTARTGVLSLRHRRRTAPVARRRARPTTRASRAKLLKHRWTPLSVARRKGSGRRTSVDGLARPVQRLGDAPHDPAQSIARATCSARAARQARVTRQPRAGHRSAVRRVGLQLRWRGHVSKLVETSRGVNQSC